LPDGANSWYKSARNRIEAGTRAIETGKKIADTGADLFKMVQPLPTPAQLAQIWFDDGSKLHAVVFDSILYLKLARCWLSASRVYSQTGQI